MLPTNRPPTHPGEMLLKQFLEPLGVTQVEAAKRMSIPFQRLNAIVKGRRGVSADTALLFEALTRWDAQIWLTLQARWDLWHALRARGSRPNTLSIEARISVVVGPAVLGIAILNVVGCRAGRNHGNVKA